MRSQMFIKKIFLIIMIIILIKFSKAQEPIKKRDNTEIYQTYTIDKEGVKIYKSEKGNEIIGELSIGQIFFGIKEKNNRVKIGKYDENTEKFIKIIGWVNLNDILKSLDAILVKDAVKRGFLKSLTKNKQSSKAFSIKNSLFLRVISKPERKIKISLTPGGKIIKEFSTFTWYYVYDIEEKNGKIYYLIGEKERLIIEDDKNILGTSTKYNNEIKKTLLGWIEKDSVKEWCTNLVLELNTQEEALLERIGGKNKDKMEKPAVVYSEPDENSEIKAKEDINIWKGWLEDMPESEQLGRPDPDGLPPDFPRYYILEKLDNQWYKVATLGTLGGTLRESDISRLKLKINEIKRYLTSVDLVFVIDATGSMFNEIEEVRNFLIKLNREFLKKVKKFKKKIEIPIPGIKEIEIEMDIRVSLILYQDINGYDNGNKTPFKTKVVFKGIPLKNNEKFIKKKFKEILNPKKLDGNKEALHLGIKRALEEDGIWRPYSVRIMIVIADEPGDTTYKDQKEVYEKLPRPSKSILKKLKHIINPKILKKDYTTIYGLYTKDKSTFEKFKENLKLLTDINKRVFFVENFSEDNRKDYFNILFERIEEANKKIEKRINTFWKEILDKKQITYAPNEEASIIMEKIAIEEALKSAGVSFEELCKLTNTAYVEGYVKKRQKNHTYDTYRIRVLLKEKDIRELEDKSHKLSESIKNSLDDFNFMWKDPKEIIAEILVRAIAKVTAISLDEKKLNEFKRELLKFYQDKPLRQLLKMRDSIPINLKGILGMKIKDILKLKRKDLIRYARQMKYKSKCLKNILDNSTAPEDPSDIGNWIKGSKIWFFYPKGRKKGRDIKFYYVPINYIP